MDPRLRDQTAMDQSQQHPHQQQTHIPDDHNPNLAPSNYGFYPTEQDPSYGLAYNPQMSPYQVVQHPGPQTRQLSATDLQQQGMQHFHHLSLMPPHQYPPPVYNSSPQHVTLPLSASPPPQSPNMYDPLSPPVSGSDTSGDGIYPHHSRNSSASSPSSSRAGSLVHRNSVRYNPTPSPTSSSSRRRGRSFNADSDEDDNMALSPNLAHSRKEATRRQRIEAEQRRRDELRDGYAKLKDVLPVSNQKSSKVSLLERAMNHIVALEKSNHEMQARISQFEQEIQRLRAINEKISLGVNDTPSPGQSSVLHAPMDARPISPPPEGALPQHSLAPVRGQEPPKENSSPPSENGF